MHRLYIHIFFLRVYIYILCHTVLKKGERNMYIYIYICCCGVECEVYNNIQFTPALGV